MREWRLIVASDIPEFFVLCVDLCCLLFFQHYMLNNDINEQLANAADVKEGDVVLEIGPGTGSLTNVLIGAGATVLAIEKVIELSS